ncbi:hypothetical protein [Thermoanaerobacterium xylanolyticum]|uniref:hypothetical protein n=1 Tax=Thermoanaerobacterium xylanolyticum TaxID=29329 RepID=UPI0012B64E29|nr:hypothetical protein [Thermoanaerobacterium xylanolyticum]
MSPASVSIFELFMIFFVPLLLYVMYETLLFVLFTLTLEDDNEVLFTTCLNAANVCGPTIPSAVKPCAF